MIAEHHSKKEAAIAKGLLTEAIYCPETFFERCETFCHRAVPLSEKVPICRIHPPSTAPAWSLSFADPQTLCLFEAANCFLGSPTGLSSKDPSSPVTLLLEPTLSAIFGLHLTGN
jgi:hypothetical protein